ncbi:leucyl aminopeptidase [Candidatus Venteria ishoeyi]|uniref:Probable cytosol aminopeptidase n=1 Tax=Candidatus Venteria ishoeyi TaxID=1899563 RepID=A0A1H6F411_9GAMM|nr:leucyl aminopeptidase [Candidatus Venteria ishoeyi]SEH04822.1 Cytosol aminopeptidase [Candidatus Venteria ishoeyi]
MEYSITSGHPEKQRSACVIVGVYESRRLSEAAKQLDDASDKYLSSILHRGDLEGKLGQTLLLHNVPGTLADRVLLVGCGRKQELGERQYKTMIQKMVLALKEMGGTEVVCYLSELLPKGRDVYWAVRIAIETSSYHLYQFTSLKTLQQTKRHPLRKITFCVSLRKDLDNAEQAAIDGRAIVNGTNLARNLANAPPNICTPTYMAEQSKALCKLYQNIRCDVLEEAAMEELGMNAFLAVSKGSREPAKLIVLHYQGADESVAPVALVGKGVTFDAGGISIKPGPKMDEMKYDMCGAAGVLGALAAVAELQLPLNLVVLLACTENLPDGNATRPGDILTTLSGQTIEILNTDAEGRMVLCDTLTYCERYKPAVVIDVATLTGACIVGLGHHPHGLFSNHKALAHKLLHAGEASHDRAWELPLWDEYHEQLASPFADMTNVGGKPAGAITAACFLSRFAKKFHWAHVDIAGTAWVSGNPKKKGATGRPVPMLVQYLLDRCKTMILS